MKFFAGILAALAITFSCINVVLFTIFLNLAFGINPLVAFLAGLILVVSSLVSMIIISEDPISYVENPNFSKEERGIVIAKIERQNDSIVCRNSRNIFLINLVVIVMLSLRIYVMMK